MNRRGFAVVYTVIAVAALALSPTAAHAQSESGPRTGWGDPDLQGVWNNATLTPFQRPVELGTQEFLTEEEAAAIAQRNVDRNADLWEAPAQRTEAGGNVGAYNNFWMERGPGRWSRPCGRRSSPIRRTGGCRR